MGGTILEYESQMMIYNEALKACEECGIKKGFEIEFIKGFEIGFKEGFENGKRRMKEKILSCWDEFVKKNELKGRDISKDPGFMKEFLSLLEENTRTDGAA